MEFLGGGSAIDLLKPGPFDEASIAIILRSLLKGLNYLHSSGKIHRDLKAANILLSAHGDVKIADFGVATQLSNNLSKRNTFVGTPFWMAPEVIVQDDYGYEADIWSLGITAMEMLRGEPPLASVHPMKVLFLIPKNEPPKIGESESCSKDFREFVDLCLKKRPEQRATVSQLLKHRFIRNAGKKSHLVNLIERRVRQLRLKTGTRKEKIYQPTIDNVSNMVDDDDGWDFETVKRPRDPVADTHATTSVLEFPIEQSSLASTVKKQHSSRPANTLSESLSGLALASSNYTSRSSPHDLYLHPIQSSLSAAVARLSSSSNSITSASSNNANLLAAASFERLLTAFQEEEAHGLTPAMEVYLVRKIIERVREVPKMSEMLLGPHYSNGHPKTRKNSRNKRDYIEDMLLTRWIEGLSERWGDQFLADSSAEIDSPFIGH